MLQNYEDYQKLSEKLISSITDADSSSEYYRNNYIYFLVHVRVPVRLPVSVFSIVGQKHVCFVSSGPDFEFEASYANMVVANLLQKHVVRLSMLHGGFAALHEQVALMQEAGAGLLVEHNEKRCLVCTPLHSQIAAASATESVSVSSPEKEKEKARARRTSGGGADAAGGGGVGTGGAPSVAAVAKRVGASVIGHLGSFGTRASTSGVSTLKSWFSASQPEAEHTQPEQPTNKSTSREAAAVKPHVLKRDANKPYRNLKDVFSIGDEDDGISIS